MTRAADTSADAIARHQTDAVLALAWCAQGGSVVVATDEQRQAFIAAADPIYARLEADPLTKQLIADIRALKASTPTSQGTVGGRVRRQQRIRPGADVCDLGWCRLLGSRAAERHIQGGAHV